MARTSTSTEPIKIGQVFYSSWGYDQTNVDYYVVLKKTPTMLYVRQLASIPEKPVLSARDIQSLRRMDGFRGGLSRVALRDYGGHDRLLNAHRPSYAFRAYSFANAYLWDGKPKYQTPAGFGH